MNRKIIITLLLAIVCMTVAAQSIDEYQFHSGTAVLKGKVLNKPQGEWNIISVTAFNHFTREEDVQDIRVAADGTFEAVIRLPHSQGVLVRDVSDVFLAVGDTVEITVDVTKEDSDCLSFVGSGTSTDINRLWRELRKRYFGDGDLAIIGMPKDDIPAWKQKMVKYIDDIIADIEADRLPLPANTSAYVKEVLGASLLAEPFYAIMLNYRLNISTFVTNAAKAKLDEYYDFLAGREKWLLDNPAMLLAVHQSDDVVNDIEYYIMPDLVFMANKFRLTVFCSPNADSEDDATYKQEFVLPRLYDSDAHKRFLAMRGDSLLTIADYFQLGMKYVQSLYGLKNITMMQQIVLSRYIFEEINDEEFTLTPDQVAAKFAAAIPFFQNPIVAYHALDRYRQYVVKEEAKAIVDAKSTPEADSIFQRIIDAYKGNALYIDFWGMSCGPCRAGMLQDREKVERLKDYPVRFLYICDERDSPREGAEKWMKENNIHGEHIFVSHDEWSLLSSKFNIYGIPFEIGVDKDGNIVTKQDIDKYVNELRK